MFSKFEIMDSNEIIKNNQKIMGLNMNQEILDKMTSLVESSH